MLDKFEDIWRNCQYELSIFRFSTTKGWIWVTFFAWNKLWCYFVEAGLFLVSSPVFNAERSTRTGRVSPQVLWRPHVAWACQAGAHFLNVWELAETPDLPTDVETLQHCFFEAIVRMLEVQGLNKHSHELVEVNHSQPKDSVLVVEGQWRNEELYTIHILYIYILYLYIYIHICFFLDFLRYNCFWKNDLCILLLDAVRMLSSAPTSESVES